MNLFEKYGGVRAVHDIVVMFYDRLLDDDALADYFIDSDMQALVQHQTNFISSVMGGPASISDARLRSSHQSLKIDMDAFQRTANILAQSMRDCGVEDIDVATIIDLVATKAELIVE